MDGSLTKEMKEEKYFLRWRGTISGPYILPVLKDMLEAGKVTKHHQISADQQSWMPIMNVLSAAPPQSRSGKEDTAFLQATQSSDKMAQAMPVNNSAEMPNISESIDLKQHQEPQSHSLRLTKNHWEPEPPSFPVMQQDIAPPALNIQNAVAVPISQRTSGLAVASLVLGILGVLFGWLCFGLVFSILAIVFGHVACSQVNRQPAGLTGKGMAITGFILGYVSIVTSIIIGFLFGIFASILAAAESSVSGL